MTLVLRAIAVCCLIACLASTGHSTPVKIAVYQSEANAEEYKGVYQSPLRTWLSVRGHEFDVIGDEIASDAAQLAQYTVVLASSTYIVPDEACEGLVKYLREGGRVIWLDAPARTKHAEFRRALGIGPNCTYGPLTPGRLWPAVAGHPASGALQAVEVGQIVGNYATAATEEAEVLWYLGGGDTDAKRPAVVLSEFGEGRALLYNWVLWPMQESVGRELLGYGLDYLLTDAALGTSGYLCSASGDVPNVRQPAPALITCMIYTRAKAPVGPVSCTAQLLALDGEPVGPQRSVEAMLEQSDGSMFAGPARLQLPTEGLADGEYRVLCQVTAADAEVYTSSAAITLEGELWARLQQAQAERRSLLEPALLGTLGDYDSEPRTAEGRVDIPRLMEQIKTAHMNMYDWLIWHADTDWEDLHEFLPVAKENGIKVWVTLCPPSEQGPPFPHSEPFRLDFIKWADEIGKLSLEYDNLVGFVIDDFWSGGNRTLFTPEYIGRMVDTLHAHNPTVAFLPVVYWNTIGDIRWLRDFGAAIDGIVFPYAELSTGDDLERQLTAAREWLGPTRFLMMNVYAAGSAGNAEPGPRSEEYMRKVLTLSREMCDGIRIYCLPKGELLEDHRYRITAELYEQWSEEQSE